MSVDEIYKDIKLILTKITLERGSDYFKIGIVSGAAWLPQRIPKIYLWFFLSANDAKAVLNRLCLDFALKANENSSGQYLYVYEKFIG